MKRDVKISRWGLSLALGSLLWVGACPGGWAASGGESQIPAQTPAEELPPLPLLLNETGTEGRTVLHLAAANGLTHWLQWLLQAGANPRLFDREGYLPLHLASLKGQPQAAQFLLQADPESLDLPSQKEGKTPLLLAVEGEQDEMVELLLTAGANPLKADRQGKTPAFAALARNRIDLLQAMQGKQFDLHTWLFHKDAQGRSLLHRLALLPDEAQALAYLLDQGLDVQAEVKGKTPLSAALAAGQVENLALLLERGAEVNNLTQAKAVWQVVEPRLKGAYLQQDPHREVMRGLVPQLLRYRNWIEQVSPESGEALLHRRAAEGDLGALRFLLAFVKNPDVRNREGRTPLMLAVLNPGAEQNAVVRLLLQAGADLAARDQNGDTPLHLAVKAHEAALVRLFLPRIQSLTPNREGQTPLDLARKFKDTEMIKILRPLYIRELLRS